MHICLFDIDGTLIQSGGAGKLAMELGFERAFGIPAPTEGIPYAGRTDRAITSDLLKHRGIELTDLNWSKFIDCYLEILPECLRNRPGTILPGVRSLLDSIRDVPHIHIGLLTGNMKEGALIKLRHFGLDHYFSFGGFGENHLLREDVAREARRSVEIEIENHDQGIIWVIGDTIHDIRCGRAIGAKVIAVATGGDNRETLHQSTPDHLFDDFADHSAVARLWGG